MDDSEKIGTGVRQDCQCLVFIYGTVQIEMPHSHCKVKSVQK